MELKIVWKFVLDVNGNARINSSNAQDAVWFLINLHKHVLIRHILHNRPNRPIHLHNNTLHIHHNHKIIQDKSIRSINNQIYAAPDVAVRIYKS
mgnify:CR=1 FL=1